MQQSEELETDTADVFRDYCVTSYFKDPLALSGRKVIAPPDTSP